MKGIELELKKLRPKEGVKMNSTYEDSLRSQKRSRNSANRLERGNIRNRRHLKKSKMSFTEPVSFSAQVTWPVTNKP